MQFKVPQNIDMEDKIVGPLTLIQFLYLLGGGLLVYILYQALGTKHMGIFLVLGLPIGIVSLAMAFLKIQDQPLMHFIKASIYYYTHPKTRIWQKQIQPPSVLVDAPVKKAQSDEAINRKHVEKSDLEKLAYVLDTKPMDVSEQKNFGKITTGFETLIQQGINQQHAKNQGGKIGTMGQQTPTANG